MSYRDKLNIFPIKTREGIYDTDGKSIKINTLDDEVFILAEYEIILWEMTNGQHSIMDIVRNVEKLFTDRRSAIGEVIQFYQQLEEEYCILFSKI